ncbi:MAG TPA: pyridoxal phosphate-dependent aminotransferase [Fibrobacteria bacterium]|nr:pyridoxal phosphate-dependent aminotransferase [Fibrobacteria bacterium]
MFSARFAAADHEPSPLWRALEAARARGDKVLDLTLSNPTAAGISYPGDIPALLDRPEVLLYRPDPRGLLPARQAVAARLATQGFPGGPENLLLTASTSEAYGFLFKLLCDPGDEVLIPSPTYPLFDTLADLEHVSLIRYPLRHTAGAWRADLGMLQNLVSTHTRALILVEPNNPTGHTLSPEEAEACLELAWEHDLAIIVDQVFSAYMLGVPPRPPLAARVADGRGPLVFTLDGLSKLAGLPQLKLGWIHAAGPADRVKEALGHLEWIADAYLSVNTPVQAACADILAHSKPIREAIRRRLKTNLETAFRDVSPMSPTGRVRPLRPDGGWSLVLEIESGSADDEAFALGLLQNRGVYVHPGHLFGFPDIAGRFHLVLSLLTSEADFAEGLRRIQEHAEGIHG